MKRWGRCLLWPSASPTGGAATERDGHSSRLVAVLHSSVLQHRLNSAELGPPLALTEEAAKIISLYPNPSQDGSDQAAIQN